MYCPQNLFEEAGAVVGITRYAWPQTVVDQAGEILEVCFDLVPVLTLQLKPLQVPTHRWNFIGATSLGL